MERKSVKSSHLAAVGYDPAAKKMHIEYANGAVYEGHGVPAHLHIGLMDADSAGEFFVKHLKKEFNWKRVSE